MTEPLVIDLTGDNEIEVIDLTGDDPPYHGIQGQRPLPVFGATAPIATPPNVEHALPPAPGPRRSHRLAEIQLTKRRNLTEAPPTPPKRKTRGRKRNAAPAPEPDLLSDLLTALNDPTPNTLPLATHAREAKQLDLFSDGSFLPSGRYGGCGVAYKNSKGNWCGRAVALGKIDGSGEAELDGVYEALKMAEALIGTAKVLVIHSDLDSIPKKLSDARARGSAGQPVVARLLAQEARLTSQGVAVHVQWVRGHSVSIGNNVADMLAGFGSQTSKSGKTGHFDNPDSAALEHAVRTAKQRQIKKDRKQHKAMVRGAAK